MGCLFTVFSWSGFFGGPGFTFTSFSSTGGRFLGGPFSGLLILLSVDEFRVDFSLFWGSG